MSCTLAGVAEKTLQPCDTTSTIWLGSSSLTSCPSGAIRVLQLSRIYCDGWVTLIKDYERRTLSICLATGASLTILQPHGKYDIGLRGHRYIQPPSNPISAVQSSTWWGYLCSVSNAYSDPDCIWPTQQWFITLFCKDVLYVSIDKDCIRWTRGSTQLL